MSTVDDSWDAWFQRHGPALVLFARQFALDAASAEDIVQEAFICFWRHRAEVEDLLAYLYCCVRSAGLDGQRGRSRQATRELESASLRPVTSQPLFVRELENRERTASIERSLADLPAEQREVVILKIWGELTFRQIAVTVDAPANTCASRYRLGLQRLKAQLAEEYSHEP